MRQLLILLSFLVISCKQVTIQKEIKKESFTNDLTISFGACNNQNIPNVLFKEILKNNPEVFIWGGDIIYSDTDDASFLEKNFIKFKQDSIYKDFSSKIKIIGTWDDHDYGLNDAGREHKIKQEAQQIFLDFLEVPKNDKRRKRKGVYHAQTIKKDSNTVKIIILDTRFFRSSLSKDTSGKKRYIPDTSDKATILGEEQWQWLEQELKSSKANFTIIVSSIQFLSDKHGFESWGNMPKESDKLKDIITKSEVKNVIILSGDRHFAEISKINMGKSHYPLIDFTSSGLTHAYTDFKGEENPFRMTNLVCELNFGLLKFDFKNNKVLFEVRGENNQLLEDFTQAY